MERRPALSLILGALTALVSGFVPNKYLSGATHYGWPFAWRIELILAYGQASWIVDYLRLFIDAVLWSLLIMGVFLWAKSRKH